MNYYIHEWNVGSYWFRGSKSSGRRTNEHFCSLISSSPTICDEQSRRIVLDKIKICLRQIFTTSLRRSRRPLCPPMADTTLSGFAAGETGDHSSLSTLSGFAAGETGDHSFLITLQVYRLYQSLRRRSRAFRACRIRGSRGSLCVLSHSRNRARSTDLRCSRPFSSERRRVG